MMIYTSVNIFHVLNEYIEIKSMCLLSFDAFIAQNSIDAMYILQT